MVSAKQRPSSLNAEPTKPSRFQIPALSTLNFSGWSQRSRGRWKIIPNAGSLTGRVMLKGLITPVTPERVSSVSESA